MKLKVTEFIVELEIQAVTCPGVWLCPNGKVTLHLYMLETCTQTYPVNPVFPLLFHEKFTLKKTFDKVLKLSELQKILAKEFIYMELVQWEDCECPNVLATFRTSISQLLYPLPHSDCLMAGDVDLLMEGTKNFPGIISPKVEISTKTTIAEVLKPLTKKSKEGMIVNPKLISTNSIPKRNIPARQRRVCHSYGYHKLKATKRPQETIVANKQNNPNETEFGRRQRTTTGSPRNKIDWEVRTPKKRAEHDILQNIKKCTAIPEIKCLCHVGNQLATCKLCTKYNHYFGNSYCNCKGMVPESPKLNNCGCAKHAEELRKNVPRSPRLNICCNNKKENKNEKMRYASPRRAEKNFECIDIPNVSPVSTNRSSIAMEIHKRLEKTLASEQNNGDCFINDMNTLGNGLGDHADKKLCKAKFYGNLANFYIELSKRAHRKCKLEV